MYLFFKNLSRNKQSIISLFILMVFGMVLIFTQYFGFFPLEDKFALDMLYFYERSDFFASLMHMSSSDRSSYLMIHVADYLFMLGFYPLIAIAIIKTDKRLHKLYSVPLLALLFDFLENMAMDIHLQIYPKQILFLGDIAGFFTMFKFITLFISMVIVSVGLTMCIIKKVKEKV